MSVDATTATWKLKQEVTPVQKLILLSLADRAGENGECWPSLARLSDDTGLNRKSIIKHRLIMIEKGLIEYTGEMKGKQKQIPVMRLTYVHNRENFTGPKNGTGENFTGPKNGTGTGPKNGTRNLKEEPKIITNEQSSGSVSTLNSLTPQDLVSIYREEMPDNPAPLVNCMTGKLDSKVVKAIKDFELYWLSRMEPPLTAENFRIYLGQLNENCPGFVNNTYTTKRGAKRQNDLVTFLKWQTLESCLDNKLF